MLLWYRAAMVEGTHPMVTGFLRLKDRLSRRAGFPIEGRLRFLRRRVREVGAVTIGYARLVLEMQELWLATRIRHEEYAFVGDLRALRTRAAAKLDVKTNWSRLHADLARRLRDVRAAGLPVPKPSAAMLERVETLRQALGHRADDLVPAAGAALPDRRMPSLPPLRPRSALRRLTSSINLFRMPSLEARRALSSYWAATERQLRQGHLWRLNPVRLAWNAARDLKNAVIFFMAMSRERY